MSLVDLPRVEMDRPSLSVLANSYPIPRLLKPVLAQWYPDIVLDMEYNSSRIAIPMAIDGIEEYKEEMHKIFYCCNELELVAMIEMTTTLDWFVTAYKCGRRSIDDFYHIVSYPFVDRTHDKISYFVSRVITPENEQELYEKFESTRMFILGGYGTKSLFVRAKIYIMDTPKVLVCAHSVSKERLVVVIGYLTNIIDKYHLYITLLCDSLTRFTPPYNETLTIASVMRDTLSITNDDVLGYFDENSVVHDYRIVMNAIFKDDV